MRTGPAGFIRDGSFVSTRYLPLLREELREPRVRAAFRAARDRPEAVRRRDAVRACRESALWDAPDRPSRLRARLVARERLAEALRLDL
jgi:hypothetical protein